MNCWLNQSDSDPIENGTYTANIASPFIVLGLEYCRDRKKQFIPKENIGIKNGSTEVYYSHLLNILTRDHFLNVSKSEISTSNCHRMLLYGDSWK